MPDPYAPSDTAPYSPDINPPAATPDAPANYVDQASANPAPDNSWYSWYSTLLPDAFNAAGLSDSTSAVAKQIAENFNGKTAEPPKEESLLDKVGKKVGAGMDWLTKNKEIAQVAAGAIGGAYQAREKRAAAEKLVQDEKDKIAANSASVSGLRPAKRGLINSPLTRIGGQRVFNGTGRI